LIEVIENSGPNTLARTLAALLATASEAQFQVAFVTTAGVNSVLPGVHRVASRGTVQIITGLYQCVTEPSALRALLRAAESSRGRIRVRLSKNPRLQTKLYLIGSRRYMTCIAGSSNLSSEGLASPGELNLLFRSKTAARAARRLVNYFDDAWEHEAIDLTHERINRYEAKRPSQSRTLLSDVTSGASLVARLLAPGRNEPATNRHNPRSGEIALQVSLTERRSWFSTGRPTGIAAVGSATPTRHCVIGQVIRWWCSTSAARFLLSRSRSSEEQRERAWPHQMVAGSLHTRGSLERVNES
jgi:HKD family nuclease